MSAPPAVGAAVEERARAAGELTGASSLIAEAARAMAGRFRRGGRLLVFGTGRAAADAGHVSVEFVHPVIVGKRALPALTLTGDVATLTGVTAAGRPSDGFAHQIRLLGRPGDMALGIADRDGDPSVERGLEEAAGAGLLTVALVGGRAAPEGGTAGPGFRIRAGSDDPLIVKEMQVTSYHVLWELVHVFLDHPEEPER